MICLQKQSNRNSNGEATEENKKDIKNGNFGITMDLKRSYKITHATVLYSERWWESRSDV